MTEVEPETLIPFSEIRVDKSPREIRCQIAELFRVRPARFEFVGGSAVEVAVTSVTSVGRN
jgi:hypothetical protein